MRQMRTNVPAKSHNGFVVMLDLASQEKDNSVVHSFQLFHSSQFACPEKYSDYCGSILYAMIFQLATITFIKCFLIKASLKIAVE